MSETLELLVNATAKLNAAIIRRVAELRNKADFSDAVAKAIADGISSRDQADAVVAWLTEDAGSETSLGRYPWTAKVYGFSEGKSEPVQEGRYRDLPENHRVLLGRVIGRLGNRQERGLAQKDPTRPSESVRNAIKDDRATFRTAQAFKAAFEWVEDVGNS